MIDQIKWLGKKDELMFEQRKFSGELAGKSWKYAQNLNSLIRVRAIIFILSLIVLYPVISNYIFYDFFMVELLIERIVYSLILIISGVIFNKYRIISIILASIPLLVILFTYITYEGHFDYRRIGFTGAMLALVLSGVYHHVQVLNIKKDLESYDLENQLISNT